MKRLKRSECAVLPLVLKGKWYDMIERGEKKEEYRDDKYYWGIRLGNWDDDGRTCVVEFRRGYGRNAPRMAFTSPAFCAFVQQLVPTLGGAVEWALHHLPRRACGAGRGPEAADGTAAAKQGRKDGEGMSVTDDMVRAVKFANRRFPLRKVKSCWTCTCATGECLPGCESDVHVHCERRYEGLNDGVVKYSDVVRFDEVCPLWEERTGEMPIRILVAGVESEVKG